MDCILITATQNLENLNLHFFKVIAFCSFNFGSEIHKMVLGTARIIFSLMLDSKEGRKKEISTFIWVLIALHMYRCESIFPPRKEQVVILHLDSKRWSCSALRNLQNCLPGEPVSELSAIQQKNHSAINTRLLRMVYSISFCITLCTSWSLFFVLSLFLNITYLNDLSDNMWGHERLDRSYFHETNLSFLHNKSSKVYSHR